MNRYLLSGRSPIIAVFLAAVPGWTTLCVENACAYEAATGNAPLELIIPRVAPAVFQDFSPNGGDATLVLRVTGQVTNAWHDAAAPYHPTAVGVYSRIANRPAAESADNTNINTATLYSSYRVLRKLMPNREPEWRQMLTDAGLDPDNDSTDLTTAIGIGNVAGTAVAEGRLHDGMNQTGEINRSVHPQPYADYTGYAPVNTAYRLKNPSRWQPDVQRQGAGLYKVQQFVTPQYANVEPYSYDDPRQFRFPTPRSSQVSNKAAYKAQVDEVLAASAALNEQQKLKAELFDDKIRSLGFSAVFAAQSRQLPLLDFIFLDFLTNMAAFDAGIVVWQEKARHDAVRPFSAIGHIYGDTEVGGWGGPGAGTVLMPAGEWTSYLEEADHPEYPSASACFCAAHAQSARRYLGDDTLNFPVEFPAGSSRIEPGITPANDVTMVFPTWTDFELDCGHSRVWAGVHFQAAVDESLATCSVFGDLAYAYMESLLDGTAPERGPSRPLRDPSTFVKGGGGHEDDSDSDSDSESDSDSQRG